LDLFCERRAKSGRVCEVACGPGEVAAYVANAGVHVYGIDISEKMIEVARRLSPTIHFETGDMASLNADDNSLAGIVGFYAIVNLSKQEIERALSEFYRTLQASAPLLLSFHVGDETLHVTDFLGKSTSLDFIFYPVETIKTMLESAGFHVDEIVVRSPYVAVEHPSQRAYVFARKEFATDVA
jgi:ubiquinone/menaquinone biosynthesis C-methylase UbiE